MAKSTSNTSKGKRAEQRVRTLMKNLGYTLVAQAKNTGFYRGGQWQSGGAIDLLEGAIDQVHSKATGRVVFSSVTHIGAESPRRQKLRKAPVDPEHGTLLLWAWDSESKMFRLYRAEEDFLEAGWRIAEGDTSFPWENPQRQVQL